MADVIRRTAAGPVDIIEFSDGTRLTVPKGTAPQAQPKTAAPIEPIAPLPVQSQRQQAQPMPIPNAAPQQMQDTGAQDAARNTMTPYGLPLQDVRDIVSRPVYQPGRAAYDPRKEIAQQVAVPVSTQTQTVGAKPFEKDQYLEVQQKEREAQQMKADADMLAASNDVATQRATASELQSIYEDQQAKQRAAEDRYNAGMVQLTDEAKQVAQKKVNPTQVFDNMGTMQKALFALSAGLGGYATQGRSNQTLDMLQNLMAADINAQQNQINREQGQADNALARLSQRWGSLEAGRSALKVQQYEVLKQKLAAQAAEIGTAKAKANADAQAKLLEAQQQRELVVLQNAARGQTTETTVSQMRAPIAGVAGGYRAPTEAELDKRIAREQALRKSGQEIVGSGLENELKGQKLAGGGPENQEKIDAQVSQYGTRQAANVAAKEALDRFVAENDIKRGKDGNLLPPSDIAGFGRLGQHAPNAITSQQGINNRAAIEQIVFNKVQAAFGAANDAQVKMISDIVIGNGTPEHITSQLNQIDHTIQAQAKNIEASFRPEVRQQYQRNKGSYVAEETAKDKAWQPVKFEGQ